MKFGYVSLVKHEVNPLILRNDHCRQLVDNLSGLRTRKYERIFSVIHYKKVVDEPFYEVDIYIHLFLTTATHKDMPINTTPDTYLLATRNTNIYRK